MSAASSIPNSRCATANRRVEVADGADALVVVTEWREFRTLDLAELAASMATPVLVDGRNMFQPETAIAAGFEYSGIGRAGTTRPARRTALTA